MFLKSWLDQSWRLGLVGSLPFLVLITQVSNQAFAQIQPDNSLGAESSQVAPLLAPGLPIDQITGGAVRGTNLFHSFEQFNLGESSAAYFDNPSGIENILTRITGGSRSEIMGTLGVLGNANLFLINPNGIIFGPNSSLEVLGSFVATTANAIGFGTQGFFSASVPNLPSPLLTVNPSVFFFNQATTEPLINQSSGGLKADQNLLLLGGDVILDGGTLRAPGGRIELGGVAGSGTVELVSNNNNWQLSYPAGLSLADISLTNGARVDASSGGNVRVSGQRVTLTEGSQIGAGTFGDSQGGTLSVFASESVQLIGTSANSEFASGLFTQTEGSGAAGELTIETSKLIVRDGAQVSASTLGEGQGGTLKVKASESVELIGSSPEGVVSGLFAVVQQGSGTAGDITIETGELIAQDGAQVTASNLGQGQGKRGNLTVKASELIELNGTTPDGELRSGLLVGTSGIGAAGDLTIETGRLIVKNGAFVSAGSLSEGQGGLLTVNASDSVQIVGTSADGEFASSLLTQASGSGAAGDLKLTTGELVVQDGAQVTVSNQGTNKAGNLEITANSITLNNQAALSATTKSDNGGNISLNVQDLLLLRDNSNISTEAGTAQAGGDGGNVEIKAQFIVAFPLEDSNINANAFTGKGGSIEITTQGIYGFQFPQEPTSLSDITASSQFGISGQVKINTANLDPSQDLINLPTEPGTAQVDQSCQPGGGLANSSFTITGRGGLPASPNQALNPDDTWEDLRLGESTAAVPVRTSTASNDSVPHPQQISDNQPRQIIKAQGWVFDANGKVVLTASPVNLAPGNRWLTPFNCQQLTAKPSSSLTTTP
ncbi:two-partner secretion domain-containing protein [Lyngbya aestuarii]|uniref:two-partner secretion domain-containing protein n=1 Tax=Lyngbya aestuarii TaxID=118322 RepID=UPI00403E13FE